MADERFNPVKAGDSLANLRSAADFKDDGILDERHDHDRSVGTDDDLVVLPEPKKTVNVKPTTEEMFEMNKTAEGRAAVAEMLGILNVEVTGDEVIDIPHREEFDELVEMTGGKEMVKQSGQDLREIVALADIDLDEELAGITIEEANLKIAEEIKDYREILGNPMRAQALLAEIYSHPMREPGRSYFMGKGPPALNDAIARLWAATTGELMPKRPRGKGDGWIY